VQRAAQEVLLRIFVLRGLARLASCGVVGAAELPEAHRLHLNANRRQPALVQELREARSPLLVQELAERQALRESIPRRSMRAAVVLAEVRLTSIPSVSTLWSFCDVLGGRSSIYACRACNTWKALAAMQARVPDQ
jgi:hypothetical protein